MVFRLMIQQPNDYISFWRVDVMASKNLINDFIKFCNDNFGIASSDVVGWFHAMPNITRWCMITDFYLDPPWLKMYFKNQEDIALIKLFFPDILND